ncbi:Alpha/Beta hydrolase protein [Dichotomopilus funicola]|uniref:Alpha/Beta hydrolase protein n=1 Tax=Dichotomopilus funicola TaxID=1934379 RepID=A0AAN6UYZ4_9PEZI|nr:Alpha/Beta hydrolase protein [Dichotomopilus funicola]
MTPKPPPPRIPTAAETLKHPAFRTAIWRLKPDRKGLAAVGNGRGGPFRISWEIHGVGPIKVVLIMGLGALKSAWQRQTLHFGHERRDEYSVLLFDNRGVGESDKPFMRYSTSEMALDIAELLADPAVGWLPSFPLPSSPSDPPAARTLHVVGTSMGGMIAQELAVLIPHSLASLSLIGTAAAVENTTTFTENIMKIASMILPKGGDRSMADATRSIFAHEWISLPDDVHLPDPATTPGCLPPFADSLSSTEGTGGNDDKYLRFDTNAQRFVAQELHKQMDPAGGRFKLKGFILQLIAAGWHRKSPEQLAAMADAVGRERILIMHGVEDGMITIPHGHKLIDYVKPEKGLVLEGLGHAPLLERWKWFHELLTEHFLAGEKLSGRG